MAVNACDPVVDVLDEEGLEGAVFFSLDVLEVVGMDDADDVVELVRPALAMVVPIEVLWFFQNCYIGFFRGDEVRRVTRRENASSLLLKLQKNKRISK